MLSIVQVKGDITERTIQHFLCGPEFSAPCNTLEYKHRVDVVQDVKRLISYKKVRHFKWIASVIAEKCMEVD